MLRKRLVLLGLVSAAMVSGLLAGCRRDSAAGREEFSTVMTTDDGRGLIPIRLAAGKDEGLLAAVATSDQPAGPERAEAAPEFQIDDSSAEAVGNTIVQMAASNDWSHLPDLLIDEQADAVEAMMAELTPFATAVTEFQRTLNQKYGAHAIVVDLQDAWLRQLVTLANDLRVEVQSPEEDQARLVFLAGPPDSATERRVELAVRRVDNGWRLAFEGVQLPADASNLGLDRMAEDFRDLTQRVMRDEFQDADALEAEIEKVLAGTYEPAQTGEDQANPDGADVEVRSEPAQPRQREAVDGTFSGPGMLRAN